MLFSDGHILNTILYTPLVGAAILLLIPRQHAAVHRWVGNLFAMLGLAVSLPLVWRFPVGAPGFHFVVDTNWIPSIGARYTLGIDGISLLMVMLTTVLGAIAVLSSWTAIRKREKEFYILMLMLQTGMLGVFMSLDFVLFYVFWEVMLVPMYFLIGVWGSERRLYAAIKFFLYTLAGSVLMLLGILAIYFSIHTFDIRTILAAPHSLFTVEMQRWLFWAFFFAFAIKVPMFPFHTWLPDAHTEAPTAGSVILAGVLLKMGTYGFIRFSVPMFPDATDGFPAHHDRALADWNYLWSAGVHDAEGHEEADRLFIGEPHGVLHAGNFRADSDGADGQHHSADQPRDFNRGTVPDCGRALRKAAHAADFRIRRPFHADAEFRRRVYDHHAQLAGNAAAERVHRRIHHPARRIRGEQGVGGMGRGGNRAGSGVSAVAVPAGDVRQCDESGK